MTNASEDIIKIFWKDHIGRKPKCFKALHHIPCISSSSGNDEVRLERDDSFKIEADITSHLDFARRLLRKVAMDGDTYDLLIEAKAEENFSDVRS
jgi:hypothetical protein